MMMCMIVGENHGEMVELVSAKRALVGCFD